MESSQMSFRGFEHYAEQSKKADAQDVNSPPDVRIGKNIQKISHNVSELRTIIENIGTQFDSRQLRNKLKAKQEETQTLSHVTTDLLKTFSNSPPTDHSKHREWKLQQGRFKEMFQNVLKDYQEVQKVIRTRERTSLRESLAASGVQSVNIDDSGSLVDESGEHIQIESIKEEADFELIKQREEELKQLERDIVDINSMFKDMAAMISDQGEEIDRIEEVAITAAQDVEAGVKELEVAAQYQASSRKRTLIIVLVVVIIIAIVVTIILLVTLKK